MPVNSDYKGLLELVKSMSKLLLSDNDYDREVGYEVLIGKLENVDNINRHLFEAQVDIILLDPRKCGLVHPRTVLNHRVAIAYRPESGGVHYKYI